MRGLARPPQPGEAGGRRRAAGPRPGRLGELGVRHPVHRHRHERRARVEPRGAAHGGQLGAHARHERVVGEEGGGADRGGRHEVPAVAGAGGGVLGGHLGHGHGVADRRRAGVAGAARRLVPTALSQMARPGSGAAGPVGGEPRGGAPQPAGRHRELDVGRGGEAAGGRRLHGEHHVGRRDGLAGRRAHAGRAPAVGEHRVDGDARAERTGRQPRRQAARDVAHPAGGHRRVPLGEHLEREEQDRRARAERRVEEDAAVERREEAGDGARAEAARAQELARRHGVVAGPEARVDGERRGEPAEGEQPQLVDGPRAPASTVGASSRGSRSASPTVDAPAAVTTRAAGAKRRNRSGSRPAPSPSAAASVGYAVKSTWKPRSSV
jgi:hypothetical protein